MTLPVSPNSISLSQVNVELGRSATAQISMNDAVVRTLFGVPSGQISMSDGYGKADSGTWISLGPDYYPNPAGSRKVYSATKNTWTAGSDTEIATVSMSAADGYYPTAYSGNNIIIRASGVAIWSNDGGSTWNSSGSGLGASLIIGGNRAVIFGGGSSVVGWYSDFPNPTTWSTITTTQPGTLMDSSGNYMYPSDMAYVPGFGFVIVGQSGGSAKKFGYSSDGVTWTLNNNLPTTGTLTIGYGNGRLVAAGQYAAPNGIHYSTDNGATWTNTGSPTTATTIRKVAYVGNSIWLAVGDSYYYRSTDNGSSWSALTLPGGYYAKSRPFADGKGNVMMHVGSPTSPYLRATAVSTDNGANWTIINVAPTGTYTSQHYVRQPIAVRGQVGTSGAYA